MVRLMLFTTLTALVTLSRPWFHSCHILSIILYDTPLSSAIDLTLISLHKRTDTEHEKGTCGLRKFPVGSSSLSCESAVKS